MKIFAMVTTSDSRDYTRPALESFLRHTPLSAEDRFILIDNDSTFPADQVPTGLPIEIIRNSSPLGFAQNVNEMIELALAAQADLFFLNNDVIFTHNWLPPLLEYDRAICTPLSNREVQYGVSVVVTGTNHVAKTFLTRMPPMNLLEYKQNAAQLEAVVEAHQNFSSGRLPVIVLPFFCVRLPLMIMESIGYLDTSFGTGGGEDFDYAMRSYLAGFEVHFALGAYMLHFGGKSTWAGETEQHTQATRQEHYHRVFREKWGESLYQLVLKEDSSVLGETPGKSTVPNRESLRQNILRLLGEKTVAPALNRKP